ncbi:Thioredoxin reductase [Planococcus massiliensis]|uniref:Thioredoxin reductase n=1 Tax=Planococcus massiliensis TaxID=1499687 RepID=A0A098EK17_9BACL|nr:NAD(P)/FAD-dependent oxidoreductase [Planococcus massiliensis]CEG22633.1 Thioredoxin reductase [Planococcus massiliensis]
MILDCAVVGGGPAGLSASLILGRSRRKAILFDDKKPRNSVTDEAHGFLTRDGIDPQELKRIAQHELGRYPSIRIEKQRVKEVKKVNGLFHLTTENGDGFQSRKLILATGMKEILPAVERIEAFYGTSLFSCPYCDGWELKDQPLAVISENQWAFHMAKLVSNWTIDLIVCTNGKAMLTGEERRILNSRGITIRDEKIKSLHGTSGKLEEIEFAGGEKVQRTGGFITPDWQQASSIGQILGCELNDRGGIKVDASKRTTIEGVFACGDSATEGPAQLMIAASEGSLAAFRVNADFIEEKYAEKEGDGINGK